MVRWTRGVDGVLVVVGPLGVDVSGVDAFDAGTTGVGASGVVDAFANVVHSGLSRRHVSPVWSTGVRVARSRRTESLRRRVTALSRRRSEDREARPVGPSKRGRGAENDRRSTVLSDALRAAATNGNDAWRPNASEPRELAGPAGPSRSPDFPGGRARRRARGGRGVAGRTADD